MLPCASCHVAFLLFVKLFTIIILGRDRRVPWYDAGVCDSNNISGAYFKHSDCVFAFADRRAGPRGLPRGIGLPVAVSSGGLPALNFVNHSSGP